MVARAFYNAVTGLLTRRSVVRGELRARAKAINELGLVRPHVWKGVSGLLDLDINLHMNNASYVYVAELARWNLSGLNGLLGVAWEKKLVFLLASQHFLYRAPIPPFTRYQVVTQVDSIDEKFMYMRQTFQRPETSKKPRKVYCEATVKAIIRGMDGTRYTPTDLMNLLELPQTLISDLQKRSPDKIDRYQTYSRLDDLTHKDAREPVSHDDK